jgi:hypothetical protein
LARRREPDALEAVSPLECARRVTWAISIGVAAYFLGKATAAVLGAVGLAVLGLLVLAAVVVLLAPRLGGFARPSA